jgi:hypothetical protein
MGGNDEPTAAELRKRRWGGVWEAQAGEVATTQMTETMSKGPFESCVSVVTVEFIL